MPRPAIKISVTRKTDRGAARAKPIPLLAVWDNDGRLSGSIEKGVRLFVEVDGRRGEITTGRDGAHWINVHDNREAAPVPRSDADDVSGKSADDLSDF